METPSSMDIPNPTGQTWLLAQCQEPGCSVMIRSLPGQQRQPCKWHREGRAYIADQIKYRYTNFPLISKDEFGQDLFEAITLQAGLRQAERTAEVMKKKGLKKAEGEALERATHMSGQLVGLLKKNTIAPNDVKRILEIA